ncbi:MAG: hypothetical protein QOD32_2487, partial [Pyrinomonadaceae bacterium]|nr:hypothetical protein [Pyrinomonadaceae bacterium]
MNTMNDGQTLGSDGVMVADLEVMA